MSLHTKNLIAFRMEIVEAAFKLDKKEDQNAHAQSQREPDQVDPGV
jgi:hypothetical protein